MVTSQHVINDIFPPKTYLQQTIRSMSCYDVTTTDVTGAVCRRSLGGIAFSDGKFLFFARIILQSQSMYSVVFFTHNIASGVRSSTDGLSTDRSPTDNSSTRRPFNEKIHQLDDSLTERFTDRTICQRNKSSPYWHPRYLFLIYFTTKLLLKSEVQNRHVVYFSNVRVCFNCKRQ